MKLNKMNPEQFKQTRKKLNLTQKQLAQELGLKCSRHIRNIESGRQELKGVLLKCFEYYCIIKKIKKSVDI